MTGSTHAGMIAGFARQDRPRRVIGIDASATPAKMHAQVARAADVYGIPVQSTLDAIGLSGRIEGMIIDPVFEGRSMAGLIDLVTSGEIAPSSTVLYAHLGGQPALHAYSGLFS